VTAIVLAAGAGSRFRDVGHKLTAMLPATADRPAESVVMRCVAIARDADLGPIVVVTGRLTASELGLDELGDGAAAGGGLVAAHNSAWHSGQMSSVRTGLSVAAGNASSVAVIGLADQPGIEANAWCDVAAAVDESTPIAVATYGGRRGNPVALHRSVWDELPPAGDEGARSLMRLRPELVVEVPCTGSPTDIDTAEDLRRWQSS